MNVYVYQAALICEDCAAAVKERLSTAIHTLGTRYPQGPYCDGGGEADCPQHCDMCRVFLENPLTGDGEQYVRDAVAAGKDNAGVLAEWRTFYDYLDYSTPEPDPDDSTYTYHDWDREHRYP